MTVDPRIIAYGLAGAAVMMPTLLVTGARAGVGVVHVKPRPGNVAAFESFAKSLDAADVVDVDAQVSNVLIRVEARLGLRKATGLDADAVGRLSADDVDKLLTAWLSAVKAGTNVPNGYRIVSALGSKSDDSDDVAIAEIIAGKVPRDSERRLEPLGKAALQVSIEHAAIALGGVFGDPLPFDANRIMDKVLALSIAMDDQGADTSGLEDGKFQGLSFGAALLAVGPATLARLQEIGADIAKRGIDAIGFPVLSALGGALGDILFSTPVLVLLLAGGGYLVYRSTHQ